QRIANPWTSVRLREAPPLFRKPDQKWSGFLRLQESGLAFECFSFAFTDRRTPVKPIHYLRKVRHI
ncbi:hypothetical protein AB6D08_24050, partial [Vibrio splendidus]